MPTAQKTASFPAAEPVVHTEIFVAPEDLIEFEDLQNSIRDEFLPASEFEFQCVRTIIHALWTIRRTRIVERKMQERAAAEGIIDPLLDTEWAKQLKGVLALRRQAERSQVQALKDFRATRKARTSGNDHPPARPDGPNTGCSRNPRTGENTSHNVEARTPAEHSTKVIRMPINVASAPPASAPSGHSPLNSNCAHAVTRPRRSGGVIDCLRVAS